MSRQEFFTCDICGKTDMDMRFGHYEGRREFITGEVLRQLGVADVEYDFCQECNYALHSFIECRKCDIEGAPSKETCLGCEYDSYDM